MHGDDDSKIGGVERKLASDKLVGETSQCVLIAFFADCSLKLFGGHVVKGADNGGALHAFGRQSGGDAKIGQESFTSGIEEDIFWFNVAVDDVLVVGELERLPDLGEDGKHLLHGKRLRAAIKSVAQRTLWGVLGDEIGDVVIEADIQQRQDMGMFQLFEQLRFLKKLIPFFLRSEMSMQEFYSDNAVLKMDVFRQVDRAEATARHLPLDAIVANLLPDVVCPVCHCKHLVK
jgi:hypothetical protein